MILNTRLTFTTILLSFLISFSVNSASREHVTAEMTIDYIKNLSKQNPKLYKKLTEKYKYISNKKGSKSSKNKRIKQEKRKVMTAFFREYDKELKKTVKLKKNKKRTQSTINKMVGELAYKDTSEGGVLNPGGLAGNRSDSDTPGGVCDETGGQVIIAVCTGEDPSEWVVIYSDGTSSDFIDEQYSEYLDQLCLPFDQTCQAVHNQLNSSNSSSSNTSSSSNSSSEDDDSTTSDRDSSKPGTPGRLQP